MEYDFKICLLWAGFFKVGLPKKTRWVFLGTYPGVRTLVLVSKTRRILSGFYLWCHAYTQLPTDLLWCCVLTSADVSSMPPKDGGVATTPTAIRSTNEDENHWLTVGPFVVIVSVLLLILVLVPSVLRW